MKHIMVFPMPEHEQAYKDAKNGCLWKAVVYAMAEFLAHQDTAKFSDVESKLWADLKTVNLDPYKD